MGKNGDKLRPKYQVQKIVGAEPKKVYGLEGPVMLATDPENVDSPFVLMPRKDPAAFVALVTYARYCEPDLAREIRAFLYNVASAEPIFGTQGLRNFQSNRRKAISDIILPQE